MKKLVLEINDGIILNLNKLNDLPLTAIPDLKKKVMQLSRGVTTPKVEAKGFDYKKELLKLLDGDQKTTDSYLKILKDKKKSGTEKQLETMINFVPKLSLTIKEAFELMTGEGWYGIKRNYIINESYDSLVEKYPFLKKVKQNSPTEIQAENLNKKESKNIYSAFKSIRISSF